MCTPMLENSNKHTQVIPVYTHGKNMCISYTWTLIYRDRYMCTSEYTLSHMCAYVHMNVRIYTHVNTITHKFIHSTTYTQTRTLIESFSLSVTSTHTHALLGMDGWPLLGIQ